MLWPFLTFLILTFAVVGISLAFRRGQALREQLRQAQLELADIRVARHAALTEEQTKQQTVFNSLVEGLLILDETGRIQFANPTFERIFGVGPEIRGQSLLENLRSPVLHEVAQETLRTGRVTCFELLLPGAA